MSPISRLLIFTKGGLLGIIDMTKDKVEFTLEWPEEFSISGMAFIAALMSVFERAKSDIIVFDDIMKYAPPEAKILLGEKGMKILRKPFWLAYIDDVTDYVFVAEYSEKENKERVIDFLKRLATHLKDIPEEAILVCTEALKMVWEEFMSNP